jgi:hypothetical protein
MFDVAMFGCKSRVTRSLAKGASCRFSLTARLRTSLAQSGRLPAAPHQFRLSVCHRANRIQPQSIRAVAAVAVPDTAGLTSGYADARNDRLRTADTPPLFESMFTTPARHGVSPSVSSLWTPANARADNAVRALDLFTDTKPAPRKPGGGNV